MNEQQRVEAITYINEHPQAAELFKFYFDLTTEHIAKLRAQDVLIGELQQKIKDSKASQ